MLLLIFLPRTYAGAPDDDVLHLLSDAVPQVHAWILAHRCDVFVWVEGQTSSKLSKLSQTLP